MARLRAFILDVDGTILDSNRLHAEAWSLAFAAHGLTIAPADVLPHIGKGSDKLLPALAPQLAKDAGDAVRHETPAHFSRLAHERGVARLPGVDALVDAARARGLRLAIGSSARRKDFETLMKTSGVDLTSLVDELVLGDDVEGSKPEPDLVAAAIAKLGLPADACAMVGDTPYDAEAGRRAGAAAVGVLTGVHDAAALRRGGALWVYRDLAALAAAVDDVIGGERAV